MPLVWLFSCHPLVLCLSSGCSAVVLLFRYRPLVQMSLRCSVPVVRLFSCHPLVLCLSSGCSAVILLFRCHYVAPCLSSGCLAVTPLFCACRPVVPSLVTLPGTTACCTSGGFRVAAAVGDGALVDGLVEDACLPHVCFQEGQENGPRPDGDGGGGGACFDCKLRIIMSVDDASFVGVRPCITVSYVRLFPIYGGWDATRL